MPENIHILVECETVSKISVYVREYISVGRQKPMHFGRQYQITYTEWQDSW